MSEDFLRGPVRLPQESPGSGGETNQRGRDRGESTSRAPKAETPKSPTQHATRRLIPSIKRSTNPSRHQIPLRTLAIHETVETREGLLSKKRGTDTTRRPPLLERGKDGFRRHEPGNGTPCINMSDGLAASNPGPPTSQAPPVGHADEHAIHTISSQGGSGSGSLTESSIVLQVEV